MRKSVEVWSRQVGMDVCGWGSEREFEDEYITKQFFWSAAIPHVEYRLGSDYAQARPLRGNPIQSLWRYPKKSEGMR
jgi:hypothetical protein